MHWGSNKSITISNFSIQARYYILSSAEKMIEQVCGSYKRYRLRLLALLHKVFFSRIRLFTSGNVTDTSVNIGLCESPLLLGYLVQPINNMEEI